MGTPQLISLTLFTLSFLSLVVASLEDSSSSSSECVYSLYVETGSIIKAGTDSKISVTLSDSTGHSVGIPDLEKWGVMGPRHDYYERGNLDIFTGRGPCIGSPVCRLNLTSDGSGAHHGWLCNYVEVTSTGPHRACSQSIFFVNEWIAFDAPPFGLNLIMDGCRLGLEGGHSGPLVVKRPIESSDE